MEARQSTIGPRELARLTHVSTDTLRHYERKGLLPAPPRTSAGYRRYPSDSVERIQLIQRALIIGFSLDDLARVLRERDRGGAPCQRVRAIVSERLIALDRQFEELAALRAELRTLLKTWDTRLSRTGNGRRADLLKTLGGQPAIEQAMRQGAARRRLPPRRA